MRTTAQKPPEPQTAPAPLFGKSSRSRFGQGCAPGSIPGSQQTIRFQALQRFPDESSHELKTHSTNTASPNIALDFSRISVFPRKPVGLQPKLTSHTPGDQYEQEADRIADQVMRMSSSGTQQVSPFMGGSPEDRKDESASKKEKSPKQALQTKRVQGAGTTGNEVPSKVHHVLSSPGQPLNVASRSFMESRFGHDFSRVRVHTDARANESAREISAKAYTVGEHLAFGTGHYAPNTSKGQRLLAHELSHVIQQGAASPTQGRVSVPTPGETNQQPTAANSGAIQNSHASPLSSIGLHHLQRNPDVDFVVRKLEREEGGKLGDPEQTSVAEAVSWPIDFGVTSPLEAKAQVEVTGAPGDDCTAFELGFLQTVHSQNLEIDYLGGKSEDGSTKRKWTVSLPIRDGEAGSMWYESSSNATAPACGETANPRIGDYPTIFSLNKRHVNSKTNEYNHLTSVKRTIGFITTLVASGGGTVRPLRFFLWSYQMAGTFKPDFSDATVAWPFTWIENSTTLKPVESVQGSTVPYALFTSATDAYNTQLTEKVIENG